MAAPFRALPPGVYFNPTAEECVRDFLKPWASGVPPPTGRVICDVDLYSDSPGALLLGCEPGFSRAFDHKWLMLSRCRGSTGTAAGRGRRVVATGGSWQSEQTPKCVVVGEEDEGPHCGRRRSFGFYVGANGNQGKGKRNRGEKTPWLMEEFTALDDGRGGGADGTFAVFCKIYLTPRLDKEDYDKKRQILGDDMVALDRHGNLKPVTVVLPPELFHAIAAPPSPPPPRVLGFRQAQPARRVLGHQQGQPQSPAPAPRVLGYQQGQPPSPAPRILGHQHGQAAATPAVLGVHHGRATLPRAVPAHRDGQALLPWGVPAHHHGHAAAAAAPHQRFLDYRQGQAAVQGGTSVLHVLNPCYSQEAIVAGGHYNLPSERLVDPQQGEAMTHTEKKKPRLAYGSPAPSDSDTSCMVHVSPYQEQGVVIQVHDDKQCSAEPVATTLPPRELAEDAGKAGAEPMFDLGICVNLVDFEPFSDVLPDFLVNGEFKPPYDDDDPPPPPGFDEFPLADLITGVAFDDSVK